MPWTEYEAGMQAISRCLPTDGPEPALVTYDGRPFASTSRSPDKVRIGSPPSMYRSDPSEDSWESTVIVLITAHGDSECCRRYASLPINGCGFTLGRVMPASTRV